MNKNKIIIEINKPVEEVFAFTTNPKNTHLWIPDIKEEKSDIYPPKIDVIYKNRGLSDKWNYYTVVDFEKNKKFTLKSFDNNYFVRYTYIKLSETKTKMQYFEWVNVGEIEKPFSLEILQKLKKIMEKSD